jgi:hypothetical protein
MLWGPKAWVGARRVSVTSALPDSEAPRRQRCDTSGRPLRQRCAAPTLESLLDVRCGVPRAAGIGDADAFGHLDAALYIRGGGPLFGSKIRCVAGEVSFSRLRTPALPMAARNNGVAKKNYSGVLRNLTVAIAAVSVAGRLASRSCDLYRSACSRRSRDAPRP